MATRALMMAIVILAMGVYTMAQDPVPTQTTVSAPTITYPQTATITVYVAGPALINGSMQWPQGNVQLTISGASLPQPLVYSQALQPGEVPPQYSNQCVFTVPGLQRGYYNCVGAYQGDGTFAASSGTARLQVQ